MTFTGLILPTVEASKEAAIWTKLVFTDIVERAVGLPNMVMEVMVEKGMGLTGLFLDLVSYFGPFFGGIFAGIGSFFADMLHAIDQSLYENALAMGQLVVQCAEYFAHITYSLIQYLASLVLSSVDVFLSLADLQATDSE